MTLVKELRSARGDLQQAYGRLEAKRRGFRQRLPGRGSLSTWSSSGDSRSAGRLEDMTKEQLYERAQAADIPGRSEMSKEQLVDALRPMS